MPSTPGGGPKSPGFALPPLSPLPFDPEVQELEQQVIQASNQVSELRASMQTALQSQLSARLAQCRPSASVECKEGEEQVANGENAVATLSPPPEELAVRLTSASGKVPQLLARLEDAQNRLEQLLAATPQTVEEKS